MTRAIIMALAVVVCFAGLAMGDIYMHNPRGSNNRNRGNGVNVENANRLFDSQNNNKGGYCWGPPMTYYEGSMLQVEWTAQHGCGADHPNVDCDLILQYMCSPNIRDGTRSETISATTKDNLDYGMHEDYEYYRKCSTRLRNRGLWAADQRLPQSATAMRTRQENNEGNPHGFECEEEKDFYPYWHPTPWRDIAILTSNTDRCSFFKKNSQNVAAKFECSEAKYNNEEDCQKNGGSWVSTPAFGIDPPECIQNGFSRDNHNGNTKTGFTNTFNWVIPRLATLSSNLLNSDGSANCVFRIRYNISTGDTRGFRDIDTNFKEDMLDHRFNDDKSPVKQNPYIKYGTDERGHEWELRLALNTDQYGRTFQDRSHMFRIAKRPNTVGPDNRIINLNVRGKRGNIVQAYPAVEYDFVPTYLQVNIGDWIHFQWTGCDTNPNYAGEGTQGTDRSNIVQMYDGRDNIPMPFSKQTMFTPEKAFHLAHLNQYDGRVCSSSTERDCCMTRAQLQQVGGNINEHPQNCMKINDPNRAYFDGGLVQMNTAGTYHYVSTRNNNFSNRSQKGQIIVGTLLPVWGIVVASTAAAAFAGGSILAGGVYYAQTHPGSSIANIFSNLRM